MKQLHAATAAILAIGLSGPALAGVVQVTFDPSAAGISGAAFQADALTGGEASRISNGAIQPDGSFTWQEVGYLDITGTLLNELATIPSGLGTAYTMYLGFNIDGFQPNLLAAGYATSATMSLYMVDGASTFGIDGSGNAFVDNGTNTPVQIATIGVDSLTTGATIESPPPGLALDLNAALAAEFDPLVAGVFSSPVSPVTLFGSFSHPSAGVDVVNGGQAFIVTGGEDTLAFVPEPASLAVLAVGFLGTAAARRKRRT